MGNFHTKSKQSRKGKKSSSAEPASQKSSPQDTDALLHKSEPDQNLPPVSITVTGQSPPKAELAAGAASTSLWNRRSPVVNDSVACQYISINTYWRNLPPMDTKVFWMYSARNDTKSYHFMSAVDCDKLENAFQKGKESCRLDHGDGNTVNFTNMRQYTACGACHRFVQRLTQERYNELEREYRAFFEGNSNVSRSYWVLDCKSGYVLFTPEFQDIIDVADDKGQKVRIRLNTCYEYTIDPYTLTQVNTATGKERRIDKVKLGQTSKPVFGAFMVRYAAHAPEPEPKPNSKPELQVQAEPEPSVMEESCIYPQRESAGVPEHLRPTGHDPLDESCIYPPTHVPAPPRTPTEPTVQYHDAKDQSVKLVDYGWV